MKLLKFLILAIIFSSFIGSVAAQTKQRKTSVKSQSKVVKPSNVALKVIAEGAYSTVEMPRILIARSAKDYLKLQSLVENLPAASAIDFKKTAVVAAFAGTKNTGGYSVKIIRVGGVIKIQIAAPPKDAMTIDALTQPFAVALVPVAEVSRIVYSKDWKRR